MGIFRRKTTVATNYTRNLFYGDWQHTPKVIGGKYEKGTCWSYTYASIHIVEAGKRLPVYTMPVDQFTEKADAIEKLLSETKTRGAHMFDRAFFTQEVLMLLTRLYLTYIMSAVKNDKVKKAIIRYHNKELPAVQPNFPLGNGNFNLVIYEKPREKQEKVTDIIRYLYK